MTVVLTVKALFSELLTTTCEVDLSTTGGGPQI